MKDNQLELLGIWNTLPLKVWPWFSNESAQHLKKLIGVRIRAFGYLQKDLYHEYYYSPDVQKAQRLFFELSDKKKELVVIKICNDYVRNAKFVELFLKDNQGFNVLTSTNSRIVARIKTWSFVYSQVTAPIAWAALFDIWYPRMTDYKNLKNKLGSIREKNGDLQQRTIGAMSVVFQTAAKRIGVQDRDIYLLSPEEIIQFLKGKSTRSLDRILKARKQLVVSSSISNDYSLFQGRQARQLLQRYDLKKTLEKGQRLTGTVASKGRVRGKVRVVAKDSDLKYFRRGEILVAFQTRPHYLQVIKNSAAIVTQLGGQTSHAAIVARELNIPCIVGIPGLVSFVKTGDLIDVNANTGTVEVLRNHIK